MKIKEIIDYLKEINIEVEFSGCVDDEIFGFSSLTNYSKGTVTWCKDAQYIHCGEQQYSLIVGNGIAGKDCIQNIIETKEPKRVFFLIVEKFFGSKEQLADIGHGTYVSPSVKIGTNVKIGHGCTLSGDIEIGDNTIIYNNVNIINKVTIGSNCVIHSGVNIGHDDFAYTEDALFNKSMIKHYGGVKIGDNVFIASNCIINRGTIDDTEICDGVKIDAQCHISHNVHIGKNSALVSGSRLYGSVKTGENVYIASAIIKNQLVIGDNAVVGMGSVVLSNVDDNAVVVGSPAKRIR